MKYKVKYLVVSCKEKNNTYRPISTCKIKIMMIIIAQKIMCIVQDKNNVLYLTL